ncbi:MAG: outer membrane protein assembly factor BamA, partial [Alphaproteobacteria bacterium]
MIAHRAGIVVAALAVFVTTWAPIVGASAQSLRGGAVLSQAASPSMEPGPRSTIIALPRQLTAQAPLALPSIQPPTRPQAAPRAAFSRSGEPVGRLAGIRVEGAQRVDPGTVLSYMRLKTGDQYDRARLDESLKALFGTGYFQDVQFRREADVLVVQVTENPVINRIAFEGNQRIKDEVLSGEIQLKPRLVYTISRAQADAQRIVDVYRSSGRFSVVVEPKLIELEQNRIDLVFEITEGELTEIHRIVFIGNKRFSDGQLRDVINTEETRWYRFLSSSDVYDPDRLAFDQELLRKYYLKNGYVDFQVVSAVAELAPDKEGFVITFTVEEGEEYKVASVEVDSRLKELSGDSLKPLVTFEVGDTYDINEVDETVDDITDEVGRFGYAFVDVRPRVNRRREEKLIDITLEIGEGPKVYVERIDIVGNVRTLDGVIRRELRLAEGDAFNRAKVRESERRIR